MSRVCWDHSEHKTFVNICTTSAQRLRRWSNIVQMIYKCLVFTAMYQNALSGNGSMHAQWWSSIEPWAYSDKYVWWDSSDISYQWISDEFDHDMILTHFSIPIFHSNFHSLHTRCELLSQHYSHLTKNDNWQISYAIDLYKPVLY